MGDSGENTTAALLAAQGRKIQWGFGKASKNVSLREAVAIKLKSHARRLSKLRLTFLRAYRFNTINSNQNKIVFRLMSPEGEKMIGDVAQFG